MPRPSSASCAGRTCSEPPSAFAGSDPLTSATLAQTAMMPLPPGSPRGATTWTAVPSGVRRSCATVARRARRGTPAIARPTRGAAAAVSHRAAGSSLTACAVARRPPSESSRCSPRSTHHARHLAGLVVGHERHTHAGCSRAGGAPDAVHVVIARGRYVVVDHVRDPRHVDPSRGDVGRHQRVDHAGLEVGERALTLALGLVAVHRDSRHPARSQPLDEPVGAALGAHEHERQPALGAASARTPAARPCPRGRPCRKRCSTSPLRSAECACS